MAISNRAAIIAKTHKVLKKYYKPVLSSGNRSLLDNLVYAHCLRDAAYDKADRAFERLQKSFYDWNEIRVTTVSELAEVLHDLPRSAEAASNVKKTLQSVFEATYSFDLESLKKQNIGQTVKQLSQYPGVTDFAVAYVTQHSLGGHAIPLDPSSVEVMYIVGAIDQGEREKGIVPGLERAIPKKKGIEFASLLHQIAAELAASPFTPQTRTILVEVAPDAQTRLPKRGSRRSAKRPADDQSTTKTQTASPKAGDPKNDLPHDASNSEETASAKKAKDEPPSKASAKKKSATKQLAKRKPR
jgi:endonuclease-3